MGQSTSPFLVRQSPFPGWQCRHEGGRKAKAPLAMRRAFTVAVAVEAAGAATVKGSNGMSQDTIKNLTESASQPRGIHMVGPRLPFLPRLNCHRAENQEDEKLLHRPHRHQGVACTCMAHFDETDLLTTVQPLKRG